MYNTARGMGSGANELDAIHCTKKTPASTATMMLPMPISTKPSLI
jgi:hypothetical protein